ncbi:hypothetical protein CARUB_v10023994mg [Capsella rubella]|uniref:GAGA-binding transcriptional activator n=1 Tax=Capsella rubella TaxID=81985 RepID=R0HUS9_9BRAS|nr:protein BASIC PENTACYSTEINE7 [Capsella rubella]EOA27838.1 hypothetical protein CARUB_v10023994mg [Capsella rubella]
MNSFPSQNLMLSASKANKDAGLRTSNANWFHSYIAVPNTTGVDLSQVSQASPVESMMVPQSRLSHPITVDYRNGVESVEQKSTNQSLSKALKPKTPRKKRATSDKSKKTPSIPETKREKKNLDINIDISSFDTSEVPPPVCSCTGVSRVCYKWGMGGWQSSCCTISISTYPLPMSTTRPGARLAGRKMSNGAYVKLLVRLAGEGYNLSHPVDLKNHWARHGTNKFVTIK